MSGLEPLAVVALTCNIIELIHFGRDVASTCASLAKTGETDPELAARTALFEQAFAALDKSLAPAAGSSLDPHEQRLVDISKKALAAAKELRVELEGFSKATSKTSRFSNALKRRWKEEKVKKLERSMKEYQNALDTGILVRLSTRNDILILEQKDGFKNVDDKIQALTKAFLGNKTGFDQLVVAIEQSTDAVKAHITAETSHLEVMVTAGTSETLKGIDKLEATLITKAQHERFLNSLKYPTMNERRNQLVANAETCKWILGGEKDDASTEDLDGEFGVSSEPADDSQDSEELESDCEILSIHEDDSDTSSPFKDWLENPQQKTFWISGKAGSGKSTVVKFLTEDRQTQVTLNYTNAKAKILSHFIWSAGNFYDRSIKGLLCSLLHQVLEADQELSAAALQKFRATTSKSSISDWSKPELEDVLMFSLSSLEAACVFVDGLDEIEPSDGEFQVLELVEKISRIPGLKICVSSRPEPTFKRYLEPYPHLRVQDLTWRAMKEYATGFLQPYFTSEPDQLREFVHEVCYKADGVFLWVALVLKSLRSGRVLQDSIDELKIRLQTWPKDLHQLYNRMWLRLNENELVYRKDAAFFFQLLLDHRKLSEPWPYALTVCQILLAYDRVMTESILYGNFTAPEPNDFLKQKSAMAEKIEIRCAGLLEISANGLLVSFIHRSATEFLENTAEGDQILRYDTRDQATRRTNIFRSCFVAYERLNVCPSFRSMDLRNDAISTCANHWLIAVRKNVDRRQISKSQADELLVLAQQTYDLGSWPAYHAEGRPYLRPDFIGLAARLGFADFVSTCLHDLENLPPKRALSRTYLTYILGSLSASLISTYQKPEAVHMFEKLLQARTDASLPQWIPEYDSGGQYHNTKQSILRSLLVRSNFSDLNLARNIAPQLLLLMERNKQLSEISGSVLTGEYPNNCYRFCDAHLSILYIDDRVNAFVRTNLSFHLDLYLKRVDRKVAGCEIEEYHALSECLNQVPPSVDLVAYRFRNHKSSRKAGSVKYFTPSMDFDSVKFSGCIRRAEWKAVTSDWWKFYIPELEDMLVAESRRALQISEAALEDLLYKKGFMLKPEDIGPWPPHPFEE